MEEQHVKTLQQSFFVTKEDKKDCLFSMSFSKLLEGNNMEELLRIYSPIVKSMSIKATAAAFVRWFAGIAFANQYTLSITNKALDLSLANVVVQLYPDKQTYRFSFKVLDWNKGQCSLGNREDWVRQQLTMFFQDTATPMMEKLSEVSGCSTGQLWGQLPRKFDLYLEGLTSQVEENVKKQLEDDYRTLKELDPIASFNRKRNPFLVKQKQVESLDNPNETVPLECTCCLNYLLKDGDYCFTCPRLKEAEREELRQRYRQNIKK